MGVGGVEVAVAELHDEEEVGGVEAVVHEGVLVDHNVRVLEGGTGQTTVWGGEGQRGPEKKEKSGGGGGGVQQIHLRVASA